MNQRPARHGISRLLRGWGTAALITTLAALGHNAAMSIMHPGMDIEPVHPFLWLLATALTAVVCTGVMGTTFSACRSTVAVLAGQILFHFIFSLTDGHSHGHHGHHETTVTAVTSDLPGHEHHIIGLTVDTVAETSAMASAPMVTAHLIAALVTSFLIVHGERTLLALVAKAEELVIASPRRILAAPQLFPVAKPRILWARTGFWTPIQSILLEPSAPRGPPRLGTVLPLAFVRSV